MSQGRAAFPHGFALEFQPISIMDEPVHDRVREGRVAQAIMPIGDRDGWTGV